MQRLRAYKVQFIVAPYEADAQLAYLANIPPEQGGVAAILTEDSDLIAYGCNALLFKCDVKGEGIADEMRLDRMLDVCLSRQQQQNVEEAGKKEEEEKKIIIETKDTNNSLDNIIDLVDENTFHDGTITCTTCTNTMTKKSTTSITGGKKDISFFQWTPEMVLTMCILAGCDFLQNIPGLGFKTAHALVLQGRTLEGTFAYMRRHKRWQNKVTKEYELGARRARESFLYALVFNPMTGKTTRLRKLPEDLRSLPEKGIDLPIHIGPEMDSTLVHCIAHGYINPHTMQPFDTRIRPPVPETSRWTVQLHPPLLDFSVKYSATSSGGGGGTTNTTNGLSQQKQQNQQRGTGQWFIANTAAPNSNTVGVSHFVHSPAAAGGSGRGAGGAVCEEKKKKKRESSEFPSTSQSVVPIASQSRPKLEHVHVEDLIHMYTRTPGTNTKAAQSAAAAASAPAPAAAAAPNPTTSNNVMNLNASRAGPSRFAPSSLGGGTFKASKNPFATVPRGPPRRPSARSPQQSVSLDSLFDHGTATTSSHPQKWQQNPTEKTKDGIPMTQAPLHRDAPHEKNQLASVSLADLFSISQTTASRRDQAQILSSSIFFGGSSHRADSAGALDAGFSGKDQQEVTSPLKGGGGGGGNADHLHSKNNNAENPMGMAPRMPAVQPRSFQHLNKYTHCSQPQQQQQQEQQNTTLRTLKPPVWNVSKPTVSSFPSFGAQRSVSAGTSSGSGFQGPKRKSGEGRNTGEGGGGKKSKKMAEMQAAAANCVRISSFFTGSKKPT